MMQPSKAQKIDYYSSLLRKLGIEFITNNGGIHIRWTDSNGDRLNLYPTTDRLNVPQDMDKALATPPILNQKAITEFLENRYKKNNTDFDKLKELLVSFKEDGTSILDRKCTIDEYKNGKLITIYNDDTDYVEFRFNSDGSFRSSN